MHELYVYNQGSFEIYCTLIQESTSYRYNPTSATYVAEVLADWDDYVIDMTETNNNLFTVDMPASANGWYKVIYYVKSVIGSGGESGTSDTDANPLDLKINDDRFYWSGRIVDPEGPEGVTPPTLSDYSLISLNQIKRFLNLDYLDTDKDYLLTDLANFMQSKVEKIADRFLYERDYREKVITHRGRDINVKNWPVKYIKRISSGLQSGMTLTHSGSELRVTAGGKSTNRNSGKTGEGALVIQSISSVGVETVTELDFNTYPTIQLLVNKINSDIPNVSAVVVKNVPSLDIWQLTNVEFTENSVEIDIVSPASLKYQLHADVGAISLLDGFEHDSAPIFFSSIQNNRQNFVIVEYKAGFNPDSGDEEDELYIHQNLILECIRMAYHQIGKDTSLKSQQLDQGVGLNIQSFYSEADIEKFIKDKIGVTAQIFLAD
ncbi:MAG: hypothetical protein KOO65_08570 [Desulfobacterales bacterium]|nr:hypothetical protein [Desulfobacterales bacterium]